MPKKRNTISKRKKPARKSTRKSTGKGASEAAGTTRDDKSPRDESPRALARVPRFREEVRASIDPLLGDLPAVTLRDEHEALFHFERIDPRLAEAWKRDVVVHEGPITIRRVMRPASFGGATHYAYVDRRLLWYLSHDPSDPIGARWDGYLADRGDAPPGTTVVFVGSDIVAKKRPPELEGGRR